MLAYQLKRDTPMTDLNTLFAHTRIDILDLIDSAIEAGMIYNVDYKTVKEAANRKMEEGYQNSVVATYLSMTCEMRQATVSPEMSEALYYSAYPQAHTLNARDKAITKLEKTDPNHWMVKAAREYLELVRPVIEKLVIIKGTVVKGRKPSDKPRLTPERTLENTGTCSVCGRNVKLNGTGQIVAYLNALEAHKISQENALPKAIEAAEALALKQKGFEDNREERAVRNAPQGIESLIRHLGHDIKMFTTIVIEWVAKPLPKA